MFKQLGYLRSLLFGLFTTALLFRVVSNAAGEKWQIVSELPTHRTGFSTAVVNGKVYLIGGTLFEHARGVLREPGPGIWRGPFGMSLVEVYDPETNTWQRLADMPTARHGTKATVVDGKIYVMAGYVGKDNQGVNLKFLKTVEMYDPQTDTWVRKQDMPTPRIEFGTGVVAGKIYAIGGRVHPRDKPGGPWRLDLVEVYDPATDTWTKRAKMSTKRTSVKAAVIDDTIYAIGGKGWPQVGNHGGPFLGTIEVYEPRINRWTKKPDMPNLRRVSSMVVIADKIYLIGGNAVQAGDAAVGEWITSIEVYEPVIERWDVIPTRPTLQLPFSVAAVNGKIYVFGGDDKDWELSPTVEVFNTGFRAVTATGKLPVRWGALKMERESHPYNLDILQDPP